MFQRVLIISAATTFLAMLSLAPGHADAETTPRYAPGVLVVKYAEILTDSVQRILDRGGFSAFFDGAAPDAALGIVPGSTLDALHSTDGLESVECSFVDRSAMRSAEAKAAQAAYYEALGARYPERTARGDLSKVPDRTNIYLLSFPHNTDMEALAAQYRADPVVEWARPDYAVGTLHACSITLPTCTPPATLPNDPYLTSCGSHGSVDLPDLWGTHDSELAAFWCSADGTGNIIAILDSGIDYTHPELIGNLWINTPEDLNNLGTFEPWFQNIRCGVCTGGNGHRARCDTNDGCNDPFTLLFCTAEASNPCHASDDCTCLNGDFDNADNNSPPNGYADDVIGYDFFRHHFQVPDPDPRDGIGHGTQVSGVVAAVGANSYGLPGVSYGASVMVIKVTDNYAGLFTTGDEMGNAIDYATANGADVISMSFAVTERSQDTPLEAAYAAGVMLFASAGNCQRAPCEYADPAVRKVQYPAKHDDVMSVGGSDPDETHWIYASFGPENEIVAAAGGEIGNDYYYSIIAPLAADSKDSEDTTRIVDDDFFLTAGTSFSSPAAAGLAGLMLAHQGNLTLPMLRHAIRNTADDLEDDGWDKYTGFGRINGRRALSLLIDLPAQSTAAIPVEVTRGTTPYSEIRTSGSPSNVIEHFGAFHKPASWDIDPVGLAVTLRIFDKNGTVLLDETVDATNSTYCSGNPNDECFKYLSNPDGYLYKKLSAPAPFGGLRKIKLWESDAATDTWKLVIKGKNMAVSPLMSAPDNELVFSLEIPGKPTLKSNTVYIPISASKLRYPK